MEINRNVLVAMDKLLSYVSDSEADSFAEYVEEGGNIEDHIMVDVDTVQEFYAKNKELLEKENYTLEYDEDGVLI